MIAQPTIRPATKRATQAAPTGAASRSPAPATIDGVETQASFDCQTCGACCSFSAEWPRFSLESDAHIARIPHAFIDDGGHGMRCTGNRCAALVGVVGQTTSCAIYTLRPDVCRACAPGDPECLEARRHFGL